MIFFFECKNEKRILFLKKFKVFLVKIFGLFQNTAYNFYGNMMTLTAPCKYVLLYHLECVLKNNLKPYCIGCIKLEDKKQSAISRRTLKGFFIAWDGCELIKPVIVVVMCSNKFENFCAPYKRICL